MRRVLLTLAVFGAGALRAALTAAAWGTSPEAPLYVGQPYALTLTLTTAADEEIAQFRTDQGPDTSPARQETEVRDGKRLTTFHWPMAEQTPRLATIPKTRIVAAVMRVQRYGFTSFSQSTQQVIQAPAFSYDVVPLPGEAAGLPIGDFALRLSADAPDFLPGDVRLLTATLTARDGTLPDAPAFALQEPLPGRVWPFRITARTPDTVTAQAAFTSEAAGVVTLRLAPFRVFDLKTRTVRAIESTPLLLVPRQEPARRGPEPLRLAPSDRAAILGTLGDTPAEPTGERSGDWVRVRCGDRTGWVRESALKGNAP